MKPTHTRILFVVILLAMFAANSSAQTRTPISGEWRVEFTRDEPDQVQLTMFHGNGGRKQNWGHGVKVTELQGLPVEQARNSAIDVTMRLTREAGTFVLTGAFRDGKGSGNWTLTPSESFIAAMASRGYTNLTDANLFSAAMADMKVDSIDELKAAGYDHLAFDRLIEANIFKVNGAVISDLKAAGFENLPFNKLVEAQIFKVNGAFAKEAEDLGFGRLPFNKLVELRVHKITPEYINEIRATGFNKLALNQIVEFKIFKVTPEFVNDLRAAGYSSITPQQVVELRIFKIDIDYVRRMKANDPYVTIQQIVNYKMNERRDPPI